MLFSSVSGCRYGDKIDNCQRNECYTYSDKRRADCCLTCVNTSTTRATSSIDTWSTQWESITTTGSTTDPPVTTVTSNSSGAAGKRNKSNDKGYDTASCDGIT